MSESIRRHDPNQSAGQVLVIDPSPLSLLAMAGVLDAEGFSCTCARTVDAAVKAVKHQAQELVVFDVGEDAPAALAAVDTLREAAESTLPFILIAESHWAGLEKKCHDRQATHCLFKPIDPASLLAIVRQALWMPHLTTARRSRGTRPTHEGWLTL